MAQANNRRTSPGSGIQTETLMLAILVGLGALVAGGVYVGAHLGHRLAGEAAPPAGIWETVFGVFSGDVTWLPQSTGVVVGLGVALLVLLVAVLRARSRRQARRSRVDDAARYLGRGRDVEGLSEKSVSATAQRLGVQSERPGMSLGRSIGQGKRIWSSWEDVLVLIAGPRTQKTTCYVIPAVLDSPGAVVATSNKRDVVDATRDLRAEAGPVWVFDPQSVAGETQTFYWNMLDYVTDETAAVKLAELLQGANRKPGARGDAFFDSDSKTLAAWFLLAGAVGGRPITDLYLWVTSPGNDDPELILRDNGYPLQAAEVAAMANYTDKQRSGVYAGTKQILGFLTNGQAAKWITAAERKSVERLDVDKFVRSGGTMYLLSREGGGTAGPIITAMTLAITEAAERYATESPGGRLPVPMTVILDEAANICRWTELPNLYSHYGSRGIWMLTVLQSWSQGVDVWTEAGMNKLWSAANMKIYGGGVSEKPFLESLSALLGSYDRKTGSVSISQGKGRGRSVSHQLTRESILDVSELGALPKGRAVVLASGSRPTLIRTEPWMVGPHAEQVKASIRAHDPQAETTISEAEDELFVAEAADRVNARREGAR